MTLSCTARRSDVRYKIRNHFTFQRILGITLGRAEHTLKWISVTTHTLNLTTMKKKGKGAHGHYLGEGSARA